MTQVVGDVNTSSPAVIGTNESPGTGYGVQGVAHGNDAVTGTTNATGYSGVSGFSTAASSGYGLYGNSTNGTGVYGYSSNSVGIYGSGLYYGMQAILRSTTSGFGIYIDASGSSSTGLYVNQASTNASAYAAQFIGTVDVHGDLDVSGNLTVSGQANKSFLIDHPLDPTQMDLLHACVEAPEPKNIYDGVGTADGAGELVVDMPTYFEALNTNFRYQVTPIGSSAPALHIKQEISAGRFVIAGATPGQKLCWHVSGTRNDPAARANPFVTERSKPADLKGLYRAPEAYGKPLTLGVKHARQKQRLPLDMPQSTASTTP